ncbi:hypothetical protein KIN20_023701 [Parelaphostrongylus tenuis]|uniref:Uncharacterized protein n=1 Tax=Parelaphostrongylus tenuis TaxID=148309 RepID=A0AAD5NAC0_PARTN|nr:hypothetical protein KIN20_023701 [Parelaphostrongylus tenuis]
MPRAEPTIIPYISRLSAILPLQCCHWFPTAYFIHGPVMDTLLTLALTLHVHWGVQGVVQDYARPFVIGNFLAKAARAGVYVITATLLAVLLHFNTNDGRFRHVKEEVENSEEGVLFESEEPRKKYLRRIKAYENRAKLDPVALRKRGSFKVLDTADWDWIPHCPHGPCLLFEEKKSGGAKSRYFACAIYRQDTNSCPYKVELGEGDVPRSEDAIRKSSYLVGNFESTSNLVVDYASIEKKLQEIPSSTVLVFCHKCVDVFAVKHRCPSEIVSRAQLRAPTRLLAAKESQSGEAQFYFSDESLGVLKDVVRRSEADGVLCLGTPRLFEELRQLKNADRRLFLLDCDKRFAQFFPAHQFGMYSMLVDHFYDERSLRELLGFFKECSSVLLVCDPPFGVFMDPLMRTIDVIKRRHQDARGNNPAKFYACVIIPMFVGKHVLRIDKDYWMSDYRVTYENHKLFSNASKTIVRCFTNLKTRCFRLIKYQWLQVL